jgi:serine/threonine protein kinase
MSMLSALNDQHEAPLFGDGLGDRTVTADGATGELLQILHIKPSLTAVPSFEFALRERSARLANFRHASYARVRRIDRTMAGGPALAIVSDHIEGTRLSELLRVAQERRLPLDINAALCLIRQLVPAVALLHENARDAAHGLIAPERLVVTPQGRLVIVEHVLGAAVEQLQYGRDRLWYDFRVGMPATAGLPRFDHRSDVAGIGLVALALVLGRPIARDEYPYHVAALLDETIARSSPGPDQPPLSTAMRGWISRALQLEVRRAFSSASEAASALEDVLASEGLYVAAPVALETFLSRYASALLDPSLPPPVESGAGRAETLASPRTSAFTDTPPSVPTLNRTEAAPIASVFSRTEPASMPVVQASSRPLTAMEQEFRYPDPPVAPAHRPAETRAVSPRQEVPPARTEDSFAFTYPEAPAAPAPPVASITDLIKVDDLAHVEPRVETRVETRFEAPVAEPAPLFNPDAPFSAVIPAAPASAARRGSSRRVLAIGAVLLVLAGGGYAAMKMRGNTAVAPVPGTLVVESNPAGVPVFVDGVDHGLTPARISLAAGSHILELRRGVPRVIPFNISAGSEVSQYLEFAETPSVGHLAIQSDPGGAKIFIDGVERGVSPLTISDLSPGEHEVTLQSEAATAKHKVVVQAGTTASLMVPMGGGAASGPVSGWVSLKAPFRVQIFEHGQLLGTTDADRLMLAAGRHELELVNESLGYRVTRVVQVPPGKTAALTLELPRGVVSLNATPWAEVWIDGQRAGETPLGNLSVPIGSHEIVFRHPQLGEKRHAISVTLGAPVRLSVDMK